MDTLNSTVQFSSPIVWTCLHGRGRRNRWKRLTDLCHSCYVGSDARQRGYVQHAGRVAAACQPRHCQRSVVDAARECLAGSCPPGPRPPRLHCMRHTPTKARKSVQNRAERCRVLLAVASGETAAFWPGRARAQNSRQVQSSRDSLATFTVFRGRDWPRVIILAPRSGGQHHAAPGVYPEMALLRLVSPVKATPTVAPAVHFRQAVGTCQNN